MAKAKTKKTRTRVVIELTDHELEIVDALISADTGMQKPSRQDVFRYLLYMSAEMTK